MRVEQASATQILDAALLVNDASSFDDAVKEFVEAVRTLTAAEWVALATWNGDEGKVCAVAGDGPPVGSPAAEPALCTFASGWFRATLTAAGVEDTAPIELLAQLTMLARRGDDDRARLVYDHRLVESGRLATIGELASGVAHEINNPLFAILALTEFLEKELEPGSRQRQRVELIRETGYEIKEIVRGLLDFARENPQEQHLLSVTTVINQTVDLVRRTNAHKGVSIENTCDDSTSLVRANPNQLKQLVLNLLMNARQAMPDGGTVRVDVRHTAVEAVVTVADEGRGIEPAIASRIFEPFFTTRRDQGGSGLGLAISHGIARSHGGSLTLGASGWPGSVFVLRLPLAER
jgi:signal transduction histidine kinase